MVRVPEDRLQSGGLWRCQRPLSRAAERQSGHDAAEHVSEANVRIGGVVECGRTSLGVRSFPREFKGTWILNSLESNVYDYDLVYAL